MLALLVAVPVWCCLVEERLYPGWFGYVFVLVLDLIKFGSVEYIRGKTLADCTLV